jgi:hypothetical protein
LVPIWQEEVEARAPRPVGNHEAEHRADQRPQTRATSSDHGQRAKSYAIACVRLLRQFSVTQAKGVRAGTNGHVRRSKKLIAAAGRQLDRAGSREKAARKEFKAAGVQIKPQ